MKHSIREKTIFGLKFSEFINLVFTGIIAGATIVNIFIWIDAKESIKTSQENVSELRKQNQGSFILQLNRDFFFNDRLYQVRTAIDDGKPILVEHGGKATDQDLDDYLGMFEMYDGLIAKQIVDQSLIEENFSLYIVDASKNQEVRTYINEIRKEYNDNGIYSGFDHLATAFSK